MSRLLWMAAVGAMVFGWPAYGEESTRQDFEEFCRAWEGRWVGDVTWVADWEGVGKRGEKVTAYFEGQVVNDGNAMIGTFFGGDGSSTSLIFYDAGAKRIKWTWVDSGGAMSEVIMYRDGQSWKSQGVGSTADGRRTEGLSTIHMSDDGNTHTWKGKITVGGKPVDDQHDVWRRVSRPARK